jgi:hypothetical protein
MWEEDPRWQQANYRLLVSAVAIGVIGGFVIALWSGDWQPYQVFLEALGVIVAALWVYAALVWTVGHLALKLWNVVKKLRHKHDDVQRADRANEEERVQARAEYGRR